MTRPKRTPKLGKGKDRYTGSLDEPVPAPDDPGGAHAKGYSADPTPRAAGKQGERYNVAPDPDVPGRRSGG